MGTGVRKLRADIARLTHKYWWTGGGANWSDGYGLRTRSANCLGTAIYTEEEER